MSGSLNLTDSSPAQTFTEALTAGDVASFLRLSEDQIDLHAADLNAMIPAAREIAEIFQGRDLVQKQWDLSLDYFYGCSTVMGSLGWFVAAVSGGGQFIELGQPLVSVDLVRYRDSAGTYSDLSENVDYIVDTRKQPGLIAPVYGKSWPSFTPWSTPSAGRRTARTGPATASSCPT